MPEIGQAFFYLLKDFLKKQHFLNPCQFDKIKLQANVKFPKNSIIYQIMADELMNRSFQFQSNNLLKIQNFNEKTLTRIKIRWIMYFRKNHNQVYLDTQFYDINNFPLAIQKDLKVYQIANQLNKKFKDLKFSYQSNTRSLLIRSFCPIIFNSYKKSHIVRKLFGNTKYVILKYAIKLYLPDKAFKKQSMLYIKQFLKLPYCYQNQNIKNLYSSTALPSDTQQDLQSYSTQQSQNINFETKNRLIQEILQKNYQNKKNREKNKIFSIQIIEWLQKPQYNPENNKNYQSILEEILVSYRTKATVNFYDKNYQQSLIDAHQIKQYIAERLVMKSPKKQPNSTNQYIPSSLLSFETERDILMNKTINIFPFMIQYYFQCDQKGSSDRNAKHFYMQGCEQSLIQSYKRYYHNPKNRREFYSFFEQLLEISQILSSLYFQKVIHCDFKFQNVLRREDGSLALIDYSGLLACNLENIDQLHEKIMDQSYQKLRKSFSTYYLIPRMANQNPGQLINQLFDVYGFGQMVSFMLQRYKDKLNNLFKNDENHVQKLMNTFSQSFIVPQGIPRTRLIVLRVLQQLVKKCQQPCYQRIRPTQIFCILYFTKKMYNQYERSFYVDQKDTCFEQDLQKIVKQNII